jgi:Fe-S-cluster containining protein
VELLQALDRRALLDTPRARMVVAEGNVRADIAALNRLGRRSKCIQSYEGETLGGRQEAQRVAVPAMAPGSAFACRACGRCCSDQHLLGPVTRDERDAILAAFAARGDRAGSDPTNFVPLPTGSTPPVYLLRPREGDCSYLGRDGRCRVHAELGEALKPVVCRTFPFRPVWTPDGWHVGMSLACPTVAKGLGPAPGEEAGRTIRSLPLLRANLREVPDLLPSADGKVMSFADYARWERESLARLADVTIPAQDAWLRCVEAFVALVPMADEAGADVQTGAMPAADEEAQVVPGTLVPRSGIGEAPQDPRAAMDALLRDLALWVELLAGLEAADPAALRRFRHALLRLRYELAHEALAAAPMAEFARLRHRAIGTASLTSTSSLGDGWARPRCRTWEVEAVGTDEPTTDHGSPFDREPPAHGSDEEVQRRFLLQALVEKRPLEYGTISRGLLAMTVLLAALSLDEVLGDEMAIQVADVAYLLHHPQLTDVMDSRGSLRRLALSLPVFEALLRRERLDLQDSHLQTHELPVLVEAEVEGSEA